MGFSYHLRRELRDQVTTCIVKDCTLPPRRWSCLCFAHYMRWYLNGSFEKGKVALRHDREERLWKLGRAA